MSPSPPARHRAWSAASKRNLGSRAVIEESPRVGTAADRRTRFDSSCQSRLRSTGRTTRSVNARSQAHLDAQGGEAGLMIVDTRLVVPLRADSLSRHLRAPPARRHCVRIACHTLGTPPARILPYRTRSTAPPRPTRHTWRSRPRPLRMSSRNGSHQPLEHADQIPPAPAAETDGHRAEVDHRIRLSIDARIARRAINGRGVAHHHLRFFRRARGAHTVPLPIILRSTAGRSAFSMTARQWCPFVITSPPP